MYGVCFVTIILDAVSRIFAAKQRGYIIMVRLSNTANLKSSQACVTDLERKDMPSACAPVEDELAELLAMSDDEVAAKLASFGVSQAEVARMVEWCNASARGTLP